MNRVPFICIIMSNMLIIKKCLRNKMPDLVSSSPISMLDFMLRRSNLSIASWVSSEKTSLINYYRNTINGHVNISKYYTCHDPYRLQGCIVLHFVISKQQNPSFVTCCLLAKSIFSKSSLKNILGAFHSFINILIKAHKWIFFPTHKWSFTLKF